MKAWRLLAIVMAFCIGGVASAKLPAPSEEQKAKAAEAKAKAEDAAKKEAELLTKSQDRAAEHYKKRKDGVVKTSAAAPKK